MSVFRLDDKVAAITGGGSGIGEAICKLFAAQGAKVAILDLDETNGKRVEDEIKADGGNAKWIPCNVADKSNVENAFSEIIQTYSAFYILVNNAGIAHVGNLENTSEQDFDKIYNVNVKGVFNTLQAGIEKMKITGGGAILNLASIASRIGIPDRFAYTMSKGAVLGMTLSVARDFVDQNIRCNCISPGRVHTPFVDNFISKNYPGQEQEMFEKLSASQPIGRMAKPEEIAQISLYLCSDEAGFVTGADFPIDGGFTGVK